MRGVREEESERGRVRVDVREGMKMYGALYE